MIRRSFAKNHALDYWESGMDLGLSRDMFDSFLQYQDLICEHFMRLQEDFRFEIIDGTRSADEVYSTLKQRVTQVLAGEYALGDLGQEPSPPLT